MDDMCIPEYIGSMLDAVNPVSGKVQCDKTYDDYCNIVFDMHYRQMLYHPSVTDDGYTESQYIFRHVRDARHE